jgi:WhiB family transcriptional regulator, redox-sensing transcriptional regulator
MAVPRGTPERAACQEQATEYMQWEARHRQGKEAIMKLQVRTEDREWLDEAACIAVDDPDMFYPDHSEERPAALAVCRRCPVSTECGQRALRDRERYGVWGGMTERDRERWWRRNGSRPTGPGAGPPSVLPVTSDVAGDRRSAELDVEQRGA